MTDVIQMSIDAIRGKTTDHIKAAEYYRGDQEEVFASRKLKRALQHYGKSFTVNLSEKVVDSVLDRLDIASVTANDGTADALLEQIWSHNDLDLEEKEMHRWALVYGEAYAMVWPSEETVEIMYLSPLTTHVFYDETGRNKLMACRMWLESEDVTRLNLYFDDRVERFVAKTKKPKESKEFQPLAEDSVIPYDYGSIPIFHFRTRRPSGKPEHEAAFNIQDIINKLVVTQMATTDYHGAPQRFALAHPDGAGGSSDFEDFDGTEDDEFQNSTLRSGPGELWYLDGVDKVGQFDPANPDVFLTPYQQYVRTLSAVTSTPIHHFEGMAGAPSGEALRSAEAPLVRKVNSRQANFEATWKELFKFALSLEGVPASMIELEWEPATIVSDTESWNAAVLKINAGVPLDQVLVELGYSNQVIESILEDDGYRMAQKMKALDTIGTTIQRLGAAQAIGAVDPAASQTVSRLIASIVDDLALD